MAYLYRHIRLDKNEPFYIGIGSDDNYDRANSKNSRNPHWTNITNITDYEIDIMLEDLSWEQACKKEREFIAFYGRKDLGLGTLSNLTDGGEGLSNPSNDTIETISKSVSNYWNSLSTEAKILKNKKSGEAVKEYINTLTTNQKLEHNKKVSLGWSKRSDTQKIDYANKKITQVEKIWKNRSKLDKDNIFKKISETLNGKYKGVKKGPQKNIECPHCNKIGGESNMKRYHFDNCKKLVRR